MGAKPGMFEPKTLPIGIKGVPFMAVSTHTITFRGRSSEAGNGHVHEHSGLEK